MKTIYTPIKSLFSRRHGNKSRGQSLVETALFLPILLLLLAGVVEVSTLLVNQNRVTTSGRTASAFGAANFNDMAWPELAQRMGDVVTTTVAGMIDTSPEVWDIWSIHAVVNSTGTSFDEFDDVPYAHNTGNVLSQSAWDTSVRPQVESTMLAQLREAAGCDPSPATSCPAIGDLAVVVSVPYHNSATFLNLPVWQWLDFKAVRGLTAMRVDAPAPYAGCAILPIAVRLNQPSAYPSNWNPPTVPHPADEGGTMLYFPEDDFDNPPPEYRPWDPPEYKNKVGVLAPNLDTEDFTRNIPGVSFANARPGYLYLAREGTSSGGFGWLDWRGENSQQALDASLSWDPPPPGNFMEKYPGSDADLGLLEVAPGQISGNGNGVLEEYEWVAVNSGNVQASSKNMFEDYVLKGRPVQLIYYDEVHGTGSNAAVRVRGYVTVKILALSTTGNPKWILFEFVRWSTECLDLD
jgi:Flp pilus assembly protein TadG